MCNIARNHCFFSDKSPAGVMEGNTENSRMCEGGSNFSIEVPNHTIEGCFGVSMTFKNILETLALISI